MCLEALVRSGHAVTGVVTGKDKPQGRRLKLMPSPVKECALAGKLRLFQFDDVNSAQAISELRTLKPDIFVVVSFGRLLSDELLTVPAKGSINVHASYLPELRGPAPIQRSISCGMDMTGVSIIDVAHKLDTGDIILREKVKIEADDNYLTLSDKLAVVGSRLLLDSLDLIEKGKAERVPQDEKLTTYAGKFKDGEIRVNWDLPAKDIHDTVRALYPKPCAHTFLEIAGKYEKIKIAKTGYDENAVCAGDNAVNGRIMSASKDGIVVKTGKGALTIKRLQLPGKKEMDTASFLNGHKLEAGDEFRTSVPSV